MTKYANYQRLARDVIDADHPYPADRYAGRGIVICAGGERYFTCAWVCVNLLRKLGCTLPVQFWHLGPNEMTEHMADMVRPLGVTCVDACDVRRRRPVRILNGWELKPYAIIHSPFEEVLSLDADNVPVVNPEFLFGVQPYRKTGAIFWPDFGRLRPSREIFRICNLSCRDEPEFESGQIVLHKRTCWKALQLTMHFNEHSDFYYKHIHGDKETFHLAWRMLDQAFSMPPHGIHRLRNTMCQHDFDGRRIFQHRNLAKWSLDDRKNQTITGFRHEPLCRMYLTLLREMWKCEIHKWRRPRTDREKEQAAEIIATRSFRYCRIGHDDREIELLDDYKVGTGRGGCEEEWTVRTDEHGREALEIHGGGALTARLHRSGDLWAGAWVVHERMPVRLVPLGGRGRPARAAASCLVGAEFLCENGHAARRIEFLPAHTIGDGLCEDRQRWDVYVDGDERPHLVLYGGRGMTCDLQQSDDGWSGAMLIGEGTAIRIRRAAGPTGGDHAGL